jgi:hypothetical protein
VIKIKALKTIGIIFIIIGCLSITLSPYTIYFYYLPLIIFCIGILMLWLSKGKLIYKIIWTFAPFLFYFGFMFLWKISKTCEPETFLLPNNYKGEIRIIFNQKCGERIEYEGKNRIYRIPNDGILLTQFEDEQGFINQKFFVVENELRIEIPQLMIQDFNEEWTLEKNPNEPPRNKIAIFHAGRTYSDGSSSFYICTYDELKEFDFKYDNRRDSLIGNKLETINKYCR